MLPYVKEHNDRLDATAHRTYTFDKAVILGNAGQPSDRVCGNGRGGTHFWWFGDGGYLSNLTGLSFVTVEV